MGIGKLVAEAIDKMDQNDPEGALFQICAALESTAKAEYGGQGRSVFKQFLQDNMDLITRIAFEGRSFHNLNLQIANANSAIKRDSNGLCSIQDIIYHMVRCCLYHDAGLPSDVRFTDERQFRCENGGVVLPSAIIYGIILAVVVAPKNAGESVAQNFELSLPFCVIPLNKLRGCRSELAWLLDSAKVLPKQGEEAPNVAVT